MTTTSNNIIVQNALDLGGTGSYSVPSGAFSKLPTPELYAGDYFLLIATIYLLLSAFKTWKSSRSSNSVTD